ncbi:hypothetical protein [Paenibacillus odorifer]|uniref:hypothetical protein n=1 Tax=Paenibacillus odorifer TaxID=189426 RepID=UPI0015C1AAF9|nr:hypothetical protein [Paenibacillus odorifer]
MSGIDANKSAGVRYEPPELPNSELQNSRTPELQNSRTPELQNSRTPELQNSRTPELHSYFDARIRLVASKLRNAELG